MMNSHLSDVNSWVQTAADIHYNCGAQVLQYETYILQDTFPIGVHERPKKSTQINRGIICIK